MIVAQLGGKRGVTAFAVCVVARRRTPWHSVMHGLWLNAALSHGLAGSMARRSVRPHPAIWPIHEPRIWISEGLTQAGSYSEGVGFP